MSKPVVSIVRFNDPYRSVKEALELCGGLKDFKQSDRILIKPNLVLWDFDLPYTPFGSVTTSSVVQALVQVLFEEGFRNLTVGEATTPYTKTICRDIYKKVGYEKLQERYGVKLADLNAEKSVPVDFGDFKLNVAESAMEADKIISVPVLKTHPLTKVSLGIKNLKGILDLKSKKACHDNLEYTFPLLTEKLPVALTVIDGVFASEWLTPHEPNTFRKNLLIASSDVYACDVVGAELLGYSAGELPHLKFLAERNGRGTDLTGIEVRGEKVDEHKSSFSYVRGGWTEEDTGPLVFEKIGITGLALRRPDDSICTFCSIMWPQVIYFFISAFNGNAFPNVEVLSGKKRTASPGFDSTILFGNCICDLNKDNPNIKKAVRVRGCPPTLKKFAEILQKEGFDCDYNKYYTFYAGRRQKHFDRYDSDKETFDPGFFTIT
jgi:uncharacterized protein (DUF362 family)